MQHCRAAGREQGRRTSAGRVAPAAARFCSGCRAVTALVHLLQALGSGQQTERGHRGRSLSPAQRPGRSRRAQWLMTMPGSLGELQGKPRGSGRMQCQVSLWRPEVPQAGPWRHSAHTARSRTIPAISERARGTPIGACEHASSRPQAPLAQRGVWRVPTPRAVTSSRQVRAPGRCMALGSRRCLPPPLPLPPAPSGPPPSARLQARSNPCSCP